MSNKISQQVSTNLPFNSLAKDGIVEVFADNFITEIKRLSSFLDTYNFVGMDTEFPGTVYSIKTFTSDFYYQTVKINADHLKLIQVGITLSNSKGEKPQGIHTWQFNLKFDYEKDSSSSSSISLLWSCGIDFDKFKKDGIPYDLFGEYLISSGLVLNDNLTWICYHGSYDFAYLLRVLTNMPLPESEDAFTEELRLYFPNHYDIKIVSKGNEELQGGLNRLSQYLDVYRKGMAHQAGSDSILTIDVYVKIVNENYVEEDMLSESRNVIFGIGLGSDDNETMNYTKIGNMMCYEFMNNSGNYFPYPIVMQTN